MRRKRVTVYLILNCDSRGSDSIFVKGYVSKDERDRELQKVTKWPCGWRGLDLILDGSKHTAD